MDTKYSIWNYIRNYKFNSLFIKNFLLILILLVLPLVSTSITIYQLNGSILREEIGAAHVSSLSKVRDMMDMVMREVDRLSVRISMDRSVEKFLSMEKVQFNDFSTVDTLQNVSNILTLSTSDYIGSIYVYSNLSNYIITSAKGGTSLHRFYDNTWLKEYKEQSKKRARWISTRKVEGVMGEKDYSFITSFYSAPLDDSSKKGVVIINLDVDKLRSFVSNNADNRIEEIYATDVAGNIMFSNDRDDVGNSIAKMPDLKNFHRMEDFKPVIQQMDGTKQVIAQVSSDYSNWNYISVTSLKIYERKMETLNRLMWASIPIDILIAVIVAFLISIRVFIPIKGIMAIIDNPKDYYTDTSAKEGQVLNEYKYITMNILKSFDENRHMEEELTRRMSRLKQAQTAALQSQINPHFLYNTLQTINWLAMGLTKGENAASAVVKDLSDILRVTMETENYLIPIRDEIRYAKKYIDIQQIRYKNKFTVHWDIREDILDSLLVKMCLQPLIENAIYHGIKPKKEQGCIIICGYKEGDDIKIALSDDGVGMEMDDINDMNRELQDAYVQNDKHIGMRNVNQRLKLIFGEEYGITLTKREQGGLQVNIVIPDLKQYL